MDYLFRRLALEYLSVDERAELSIFTIDERMQPTLPGVDETVIETSTGIGDGRRPEDGAVGRRAGRPDGARHDGADAAGQHARPPA